MQKGWIDSVQHNVNVHSRYTRLLTIYVSLPIKRQDINLIHPLPHSTKPYIHPSAKIIRYKLTHDTAPAKVPAHVNSRYQNLSHPATITASKHPHPSSPTKHPNKRSDQKTALYTHSARPHRQPTQHRPHHPASTLSVTAIILTK